MRNILRTTSLVALAAVGVLVSAPRLLAQAGAEGDIVGAMIPFSFTVENTTLPPGEYVIHSAFETELGAWRLQDAGGPMHSVVFLTESADEGHPGADPQYELTFMKIGNQNFLTEIRTQGENFALAQSRSLLRAEHTTPKHEMVKLPAHG